MSGAGIQDSVSLPAPRGTMEPLKWIPWDMRYPLQLGTLEQLKGIFLLSNYEICHSIFCGSFTEVYCVAYCTAVGGETMDMSNKKTRKLGIESPRQGPLVIEDNGAIVRAACENAFLYFR